MRKGIAATVAAIVMLMGLSSCEGNSSTSSDAGKQTNSSQGEPKKTNKAPQPADLTGTWKQTNSSDKDHYQQATVTADSIEINWVSPDTSSLYWSGSFTPPTTAGGYSWTSQGNKDKMSQSLLASQDDTKDFKYENGEITYKASAMGTTTTVHLKKQ